MIFFHDVRASEDTARLAVNISSVLGWVSFASFAVWFFLIFAKKERILKARIIYPLIFFPSLLFIWKQWTGFLISDFIKQAYGWSYAWSESIWPFLFHVYYFSCGIFVLYLCLDFIRKAKLRREKRQASIIFFTTLIPFGLGTITDVLFPALHIYRIPFPIADIFILVWAGGLVFAITKYGLMTVTPQAAADNILSTMADSLILIEPGGKIITVNSATLNLLGYKKNELIGGPMTAVLGEHEYAERLKELTQRGRIRDCYTAYRSNSGSKIPVSLFMSILRDQQNELFGIVCIAKDMREINRLMQNEKELAATEKKRAIELEEAYGKLRETQEQLIQSAKMAAVGQLGAGVAHELNNPLSGILGYAQLITHKFKEPKFSEEEFQSFHRYIGSIERESARCKKIVESLLKFSRRPIYANSEYFDVGNAIEEALCIIRHQLELNYIEVVTDIKPGLAKVRGIVNQLQQVFTNLILNAQQAMPEGGKLKITAENIIDEATHTPTRVRIEFIDTGCGIPEENLSRIFEPFFTTKEKEKGTGLGLSVSYQIIQDHKGALDVKSQVGKGATFTITLPARK